MSRASNGVLDNAVESQSGGQAAAATLDLSVGERRLAALVLKRDIREQRFAHEAQEFLKGKLGLDGCKALEARTQERLRTYIDKLEFENSCEDAEACSWIYRYMGQYAEKHGIPRFPLSSNTLVLMCYDLFAVKPDTWTQADREHAIHTMHVLGGRANKLYLNCLSEFREKVSSRFTERLKAHPATSGLLSFDESLMHRYRDHIAAERSIASDIASGASIQHDSSFFTKRALSPQASHSPRPTKRSKSGHLSPDLRLESTHSLSADPRIASARYASEGDLSGENLQAALPAICDIDSCRTNAAAFDSAADTHTGIPLTDLDLAAKPSQLQPKPTLIPPTQSRTVSRSRQPLAKDQRPKNRDQITNAVRMRTPVSPPVPLRSAFYGQGGKPTSGPPVPTKDDAQTSTMEPPLRLVSPPVRSAVLQLKKPPITIDISSDEDEAVSKFLQRKKPSESRECHNTDFSAETAFSNRFSASEETHHQVNNVSASLANTREDPGPYEKDKFSMSAPAVSALSESTPFVVQVGHKPSAPDTTVPGPASRPRDPILSPSAATSHIPGFPESMGVGVGPWLAARLAKATPISTHNNVQIDASAPSSTLTKSVSSINSLTSSAAASQAALLTFEPHSTVEPTPMSDTNTDVHTATNARTQTDRSHQPIQTANALATALISQKTAAEASASKNQRSERGNLLSRAIVRNTAIGSNTSECSNAVDVASAAQEQPKSRQAKPKKVKALLDRWCKAVDDLSDAIDHQLVSTAPPGRQAEITAGIQQRKKQLRPFMMEMRDFAASRNSRRRYRANTTIGTVNGVEKVTETSHSSTVRAGPQRILASTAERSLQSPIVKNSTLDPAMRNPLARIAPSVALATLEPSTQPHQLLASSPGDASNAGQAATIPPIALATQRPGQHSTPAVTQPAQSEPRLPVTGTFPELRRPHVLHGYPVWQNHAEKIQIGTMAPQTEAYQPVVASNVTAPSGPVAETPDASGSTRPQSNAVLPNTIKAATVSSSRRHDAHSLLPIAEDNVSIRQSSLQSAAVTAAVGQYMPKTKVTSNVPHGHTASVPIQHEIITSSASAPQLIAQVQVQPAELQITQPHLGLPSVGPLRRRDPRTHVQQLSVAIPGDCIVQPSVIAEHQQRVLSNPAAQNATQVRGGAQLPDTPGTAVASEDNSLLGRNASQDGHTAHKAPVVVQAPQPQSEPLLPNQTCLPLTVAPAQALPEQVATAAAPDPLTEGLEFIIHWLAKSVGESTSQENFSKAVRHLKEHNIPQHALNRFYTLTKEYWMREVHRRNTQYARPGGGYGNDVGTPISQVGHIAHLQSVARQINPVPTTETSQHHGPAQERAAALQPTFQAQHHAKAGLGSTAQHLQRPMTSSAESTATLQAQMRAYSAAQAQLAVLQAQYAQQTAALQVLHEQRNREQEAYWRRSQAKAVTAEKRKWQAESNARLAQQQRYHEAKGATERQQIVAVMQDRFQRASQDMQQKYNRQQEEFYRRTLEQTSGLVNPATASTHLHLMQHQVAEANAKATELAENVARIGNVAGTAGAISAPLSAPMTSAVTTIEPVPAPIVQQTTEQPGILASTAALTEPPYAQSGRQSATFAVQPYRLGERAPYNWIEPTE